MEKGRKGIWQGRKGKGGPPAKVATRKCGGPPTMPEENRGPWSKSLKTAGLIYRTGLEKNLSDFLYDYTADLTGIGDRSVHVTKDV